MTLQQFVRFDKYVRCFTFGKNDIVPVAYDPHQRGATSSSTTTSSPSSGARIVKDAQTINQALGYEMNTIEFGVEDGVPYAIDFLNPAPDFERDRITPFYFDLVVDRMSKLVVDRAQQRPAEQPVAAVGADARLGPDRRASSASRRWQCDERAAATATRAGRPRLDPIEHWTSLLRPEVERSEAFWADAVGADARRRGCRSASGRCARSCGRSSSTPPTRRACAASPRRWRRSASASSQAAMSSARAAAAACG